MDDRKLRLKKSQADLIRTGDCVISNGNEYYHLPMWFKQTDMQNVFEVYGMDELPHELETTLAYIKEFNDPPVIPHGEMTIRQFMRNPKMGNRLRNALKHGMIDIDMKIRNVTIEDLCMVRNLGRVSREEFFKLRDNGD